MSTIQVRIDPQTKRAVATIFDRLGLDLGTAVKIYFAQVLRRQGVPFPLLTANGFTQQQEALLLRESKQTRAQYARGKKHGHKEAKTFFKELSA